MERDISNLNKISNHNKSKETIIHNHFCCATVNKESMSKNCVITIGILTISTCILPFKWQLFRKRKKFLINIHEKFQSVSDLTTYVTSLFRYFGRIATDVSLCWSIPFMAIRCRPCPMRSCFENKQTTPSIFRESGRDFPNYFHSS